MSRSKPSKHSVSAGDWELSKQLNGGQRGLCTEWGALVVGATALVTSYAATSSIAWSGVCAVVCFAVVFAYHFKAPSPARYCPDRRAPPTHWLLGNAPQLMANAHRLHDWFLEQFEELGDGFATVAPNGAVSYFYRDPATVKHVMKDRFDNYVKGASNFMFDMLGHGIFNVNGKLWRSQRKVGSTLFTMRFLRDFMTSIFAEHTQELCEKLDTLVGEDPVDITDLLSRFTLDGFVEIAFGVQLGCLSSHPEPVAFARAFDSVQRGITKRFWNPLWRVDRFLKRGAEGKLREDVKVMDEFALRIIRERREVQDSELNEKPDLLSKFIANARQHEDASRLLSDSFLRDLVLNFVIAGRDTTAQTLSWLLYELSRHPHVEERLLQEADAFLPDASDVPDYSALKDMPYTHAVISETLRLHPPVPIQFRVALQDDVLPDGSQVKSGDLVKLANYCMARNPAVWGHNAADFVPERFLGEDGKFINFDAFKFFSFNAGPRLCLGKPAAYLEAKMAAAMLLKRFRVTVVPGQEVTYDASMTLPIKGGLLVTVERRLQ